MRHSKSDLTANVYTDPKLLDVAGALSVLPSLPLDQKPRNQTQATGTMEGTGSPRLYSSLHALTDSRGYAKEEHGE